MYQDFSMKKPYNEFFGHYDVEFIGEKARVHLVTLATDKKSRLNQVHKIGQAGGEHHYSMIVNGQRAYFKCKHNIY